MDQLVLPRPYRETVLSMAHQIPLGGHIGRKRTTERIKKRFLWPGLRADVAEPCLRCQKTAKGNIRKVPLVPLPVMRLPFCRI